MPQPPALTPDQIPPWVNSPADVRRWTLCMALAAEIAGAEDAMLAEVMYFNARIPTDDHPVEEAFDPDEMRDRRGRWEDLLKPSGFVAKPVKSAADMAARGFDAWPRKGDVAEEVLGEARDTAELYHRDVPGAPPEMQYTEQRLAGLHEPLVHMLVDPHASQEHPSALVVAGGPASGKSTFLRGAQSVIPDDAVMLNADDIAAGKGMAHGIPEHVDMLSNQDPYAAFGTHLEAGDILEKAEAAAIKKRTNLVFDQTGNGKLEEFQRQLERLKEAGYAVDVLYVSTPTDTAARNNIHRAEEKVHYVPTPVLREKHRKVAENFESVSKLPWLNSVRVYDPELGLVAYRAEDGHMEPTHEEGYARWMAKAKETPGEPPAKELREAAARRAAGEPEHPVIGVPFELQSRQAAREEMDAMTRKAKP